MKRVIRLLLIIGAASTSLSILTNCGDETLEKLQIKAVRDKQPGV